MSFIEQIAEAFKGTPPIDPATFKDPIALQTSWDPLKRGGSNFRTHKAVQVDGNRIEFKVSKSVWFFSGIFILMPVIFGIFMLVTNAYYAKIITLSGIKENIAPIAILMIFVVVGIVVAVSLGKPRVFDKSYGYYWKGKQGGGDPMSPAAIEGGVPLSDIHALQIVSEWVSGNKTHYRSYELNLVLRSGQRVNVVDHGNKKALLEDAQMLAQFLNVPLWNAAI